MNITNKEVLRENAMNEFDKAVNYFEGLEMMKYGDIDIETTMVIVMDLNKGFAKGGNLYSPFVEALIPGIGKFVIMFTKDGGIVAAFTDCHQKNSPELKQYPEHCIDGTNETELVDELQIENIIIIEKNCTNGFLSQNPLEILGEIVKENLDKIKTVIVTGDCTDLCDKRFALTIKEYANEVNRELDVIVVEEMVDTFDIPGVHDREYEHVMALYDMQKNGIIVVKGIEYEDEIENIEQDV
ncbi:MAG TPA: cysteine hydrolase [Clostridiales bacterium]|nr:MAG: hypothetical protein A2Y22_01245 [Clostridiales bacterium GWD2_32_59]HAN10562.1 cysteine hydrolase [Clostridiales bacterium]